MKRVLPKQTGDKITGRANSKGATIDNRHYIIGGLSQQGPQTSIHSFVITSKNPYQIQWRKQQIKNIELFTLRHSFSIAAIGKSIYIFGGDDMNNGQSIGELLKYDVEKQEMSKVETKGDAPSAMNSMTLSANQESKELVLFGGVHSNEKTPFGLYFLDLTSLVWRFKQLSLECYDQGIWQHTAHLTNKPLNLSSTDNLKLNLNTKKQNIIGLDLGIKENQEKIVAHKIAKINIGEQEINQQQPQVKQQLKQQKSITLTQKQQQCQGPFLVVVGGCFHPNHPYSEITQIDVHSGSIVSQSFVSPVTGHQSVLYKDQLFVFGGSDGTAPTQGISIIGEQIKEQKGFSGISPTGFVGENEVIIFGGINVLTNPPTFNSVLILYED